MTFDVFLGCVIPMRFPHLEFASRKIFEKMGIELQDVDGFSCCPDPSGIEQASHKTWAVMGARNLSLSKSDEGIISFCSGCVETLKCANHAMHDKVVKKEINEYLSLVDRSYDGKTSAVHFAQVLYERLKLVKKTVSTPLNGFRVAVHYGCHYLRPSEIIAWDDPFNPVTVDKIVDAIGAKSIPYKYKMECCGNPTSKADSAVSMLMLKRKLEGIANSSANCVVVVCPACYQQFENNQKDINKIYGTNYNFPIFYLSQLVALSYGFKDKELGFKFHRTKMKPLLKETGIGM